MIKSAHHSTQDFGEIDDSPSVIVGGDSTLSESAGTAGDPHCSPAAALDALAASTYPIWLWETRFVGSLALGAEVDARIASDPVEVVCREV